jgi:hypothetical protein
MELCVFYVELRAFYMELRAFYSERVRAFTLLRAAALPKKCCVLFLMSWKHFIE